MHDYGPLVSGLHEPSGKQRWARPTTPPCTYMTRKNASSRDKLSALKFLRKRGVIVTVIIPAAITVEKKCGELNGDSHCDPDLPVREQTVRNRKLAGPLQIGRNTPASERPRHDGDWCHQ